MTPEQLAKLHRDYLVKREKNSAVLIAGGFESLKNEIALFLLKNERSVGNKEISISAALVDKLSIFFDEFAPVFSRFVASAQQKVISFAAETLKSYFKFQKLEISSSIFEPDKEAINKLIGRTQTGKSLEKFFLRMKPEIAEKAKAALIEGFTTGDGAGQIARRIGDVSDIGRYNALRVSRTETNEAYRAASRDFYQSAEIKKYIWLSVLDARVCLRCWFLHGQKFSSKVKIFSHPQCRCVLVPYLKNQKEIETGIEKFGKLETGFQKQILGSSRFDLYKDGYGLNDFVKSAKSEEYGTVYSIKNLSDFEL